MHVRVRDTVKTGVRHYSRALTSRERNESMTIQIDDAGYGSLVGPTFIGAYRTETGDFVYGEVALRFFQGTVFRKGEYIREASRVIRSLLEQLDSQPSETLEICTGNIFDIDKIHRLFAVTVYKRFFSFLDKVVPLYQDICVFTVYIHSRAVNIKISKGIIVKPVHMVERTQHKLIRHFGGTV